MIDYAAFRVVAAVVREGSFEKAAVTLGVTPSAVSQRVKLLEERLGSVLVVRGQPCRATEAGGRICRHVERVQLLEAELCAEAPDLAAPGASPLRVTLPIAVNADSLATWFVDALAVFATSSPHLVELLVDDQDHTGDWLRRGEVLGAVTAMEMAVPGCRSFPLGSLRYHATASPVFAARWCPQGATPEALSCAPSLTFNRKDRLQHQWLAKALGGPIDPPTHWLPSSNAFVQAALAGIGWGMNPAGLVGGHLRKGSLVDLVPGVVLDVPLYWQVARISRALLEPLTQAIVATTASALVQDG